MASDDLDNGADLDAGAAPKRPRAGGDLFDSFSNLTLLRQIGLMIGLAASVAIGFAVVLWTQDEDYRPLSANLDQTDLSAAVEVLEQNEISFRMDPSSSTLMVIENDIHQARLALAEAGIPRDKSHGFELMDQEQPLGTSQFVESTRYHRSLEGELARTITSIEAIRSARVHLAIPKRSVFVRDPRTPKGSVFVEVLPGREVARDQVKAITNLVGSSIAELKPEHVTVVDQRGNLLSGEEENDELILADRQRSYTRRVEEELQKRIVNILEPMVGRERFRATVNADIDFTAVEQASEVFNPDEAAIRSEQILNETRDGNDLSIGIPGALTNQPPGMAEAPEEAVDPETGEPVEDQGPSSQREQATRNYELDRTLSYIRQQQGEVERLSVAVVVDDKLVGGQGEGATEPWTQAEIERMELLVRDAVGFSAARGDSVNVLNSQFRLGEIADFEPEEIPWWEQEWVISYARQAAALLIILGLVFGLLRPVLRSLANSASSDEDEEAELEALEASGLGGYEGGSDDAVTLTGGALGLPNPEDSYEQQLNTIKGLVADDPGRVAEVVKSWVNRGD